MVKTVLIQLFIFGITATPAYGIKKCETNHEKCAILALSYLAVREIPLTKKQKRVLKKVHWYTEPKFKAWEGNIKVRYIGHKKSITYTWEF